jgi:hypothetical protein
VEKECVADAMVLEYRLVREAVRAFGIGVELRPEVVDGDKAITGFVGRFAAWNAIAEFIAAHTLERMVKRRREELGRGVYDGLFSAKADAIDEAHERAKEIIAEAKEDPKEPVEVLKHAWKLDDKEQVEVKAAEIRGSLDDPKLKWKSNGSTKPIEEMIEESFS